MTAAAPKRRFIPCPYCKGSGGHTEPVPGLCGDGPRYDCGACGGGGSLDDYRREQKRLEEEAERNREFICRDCGHDAGSHYSGTHRCAFSWSDGKFIPNCQCPQSRESVLAMACHSLFIAAHESPGAGE